MKGVFCLHYLKCENLRSVRDHKAAAVVVAIHKTPDGL